MVCMACTAHLYLEVVQDKYPQPGNNYGYILRRKRREVMNKIRLSFIVYSTLLIMSTK